MPRSSPRRLSSRGSLKTKKIFDVMRLRTGKTDILSGIWRGQPLTDSGKRLQQLKIFVLTLLQFLGLWAFTAYSLSGSIQEKTDIEQTQYAVKFSMEIGKLLDRIQRERDMSVLYLSTLEPETKTFLMNEYLLTDHALDQLSDWPVRNDVNSVFHSKQAFHNFLKEHRKSLDPNNFDIHVEKEFYSFLIERFVESMYDVFSETKMASIWKILVSYQKIVTGMEQIEIERTPKAVGGGFPTKSDYENCNNVHVFKANYRPDAIYSKIIDPTFQDDVTSRGTNFTAAIERLRFEIQRDLDKRIFSP